MVNDPRLARLEQAMHAINSQQFDRAAALLPAADLDDLPDTWLLRGVLARQQGQLAEAETAYRQALSLRPGFGGAWFNLGNLYAAIGEHAAAKSCFGQAARSTTGDLALERAWLGLSTSAYALGETDLAFEALREGLRVNPNDTHTLNQLGKISWELGETDAAIAAFSACVRLAPDNALFRANLLLVSQFSPLHSEASLALLADSAAAAVLPALPVMARPAVARSARIRIAYLSSDFRISAPGLFIGAMLEGHDRQRFEVWALSNNPLQDTLTEQFKSRVDAWHDVSALTDTDLTQWLRQQHIDILVDLNGYTGGHRLAVFKARVAPLQVSWLGYEGTTRLPGIDLLLSDRQVTPEANLPVYSETVARLPFDFCCYAPIAEAPPVAVTPAWARGVVTFGSFNKLAKLSDPCLRVWAAVLQAVPGSRLLLKWKHATQPRVMGRIRARFAQLGVSESRIDFEDACPYLDLLAAYARVDVALDPFPFSGGATTCDALWMGVPVITLQGQRFAANHTVSHLQAAGFPEWVAQNADDYVRIAQVLTADVAALARLRAQVRDQVALSPLCQAHAFMRPVERILEESLLKLGQPD